MVVAVLIFPVITAIACSTPFHNYLLAWRPDGKVLAVQGQGVTLYDENLQSPTSIYEDSKFSNSSSMAWNPAGNKLIWIGSSGTYVWQSGSNQAERILIYESNFNTVVWSPDGKQIAANGRQGIVIADTAVFKGSKVLKDSNNPDGRFRQLHGVQTRFYWQAVPPAEKSTFGMYSMRD